MLKILYAPFGTMDFTPYIFQIPAEAEAVYVAFWGADLISLLRYLHTLRPDLKIFCCAYCFTGIKTEELGDIVEGVVVQNQFPRRLEEFDTPYTRAFRGAIGMDPDGREVGNPDQLFTYCYAPSMWETLFIIKRVVEIPGWKSKADNPAFITTLENRRFEESYEFPQGDLFIRAQDYQAFMDLFLEQVQNGKLVVVAKFPLEDGLELPPKEDYTKEPF